VERRWKITAGLGVAVLIGGLIYVRTSAPTSGTARDKSAGEGASGSETAAVDPHANGEAGAASAAGDPNASATVDASSPPPLVTAKWGREKGQLGRERPQEGNPEGPMSLAFAGDDLLVLDQVNGRLVRYGKDGRVRGASDAPTTAQDLAVGKDGTVAMIDRLVGKAVTLTDANGRKIGQLPLDKRVGEPGLVTAVVVDGKTVYVEKEHGALVPIGTTDGQPADDAPELTGRPSKDGELLLTAGLTSKREGRAYVNAMDRKSGSLRFARAVQFPRPAQAIVLLDSDARGAIYLGVASGEPAQASVACLDRTDGHVLGRITLPLSQTPEESFRDMTVADDGTIVYALRTDDGVEYLRARCP